MAAALMLRPKWKTLPCDSHLRGEGFWPNRALSLGDAARTPVRVLAADLSELGAEMHIVAFITESAPVEHILTQIGEPPPPPPIAPARGLLPRNCCSLD
jgi:hypothetical protein